MVGNTPLPNNKYEKGIQKVAVGYLTISIAIVEVITIIEIAIKNTFITFNPFYNVLLLVM